MKISSNLDLTRIGSILIRMIYNVFYSTNVYSKSQKQ